MFTGEFILLEPVQEVVMHPVCRHTYGFISWQTEWSCRVAFYPDAAQYDGFDFTTLKLFCATRRRAEPD